MAAQQKYLTGMYVHFTLRHAAGVSTPASQFDGGSDSVVCSIAQLHSATCLQAPARRGGH